MQAADRSTAQATDQSTVWDKPEINWLFLALFFSYPLFKMTQNQ